MKQVLREIRQLGCEKENSIMMTYQTYLELTEIERLESVEYAYSSAASTLYLTGKKGDTTNVYIPVHSSFLITPNWIQNVQKAVSTSDPKSIILVIREGDSNAVFYKLTVGMIEPKMKNHDERLKKPIKLANNPKFRKSRCFDFDDEAYKEEGEEEEKEATPETSSRNVY